MRHLYVAIFIRNDESPNHRNGNMNSFDPSKGRWSFIAMSTNTHFIALILHTYIYIYILNFIWVIWKCYHRDRIIPALVTLHWLPVKYQIELKTLGKFDWGIWYVIIFLYVQFWIRLAAVNNRGKKVRTMAVPAVRSVNKLHDTRNCVQNEPQYAIRVIFTTRSYCKVLGLILCYLI